MLEGLSCEQRIEFVSKKDTSDPKTVFVIRPLTGFEMLDISNMVSGNSLSLNSDNVFSLLSKCIVEIKNYKDSSDKDTILKNLPVDIIVELTEEVGKINKITETDKKK